MLSSCDLFKSEEESLESRRVYISTKSSDPLEGVFSIVITVTGSDFDKIEKSTTDSLVSINIPEGEDRKVEASITLGDGRLFYGNKTVNIDENTNSVELYVSDTSYGDLGIELIDAKAEETDLGLGTNITIPYGDSVTLTLTRTPDQVVSGWYIDGKYQHDYFEDEITIGSESFFIGNHTVLCRVKSGETFQEDSVVVTVNPLNVNPIVGKLISITPLTPPNIILRFTQSSDMDTKTEDLRYKVLISDNPSDFSTVEFAKSPERIHLSAWSYLGGSYFPITDPYVDFTFSYTGTGIHYVAIIVKDDFDNVSLYDSISLDLGP